MILDLLSPENFDPATITGKRQEDWLYRGFDRSQADERCRKALSTKGHRPESECAKFLSLFTNKSL